MANPAATFREKFDLAIIDVHCVRHDRALVQDTMLRQTVDHAHPTFGFAVILIGLVLSYMDVETSS
jgi:hypothetical protein